MGAPYISMHAAGLYLHWAGDYWYFTGILLMPFAFNGLQSVNGIKQFPLQMFPVNWQILYLSSGLQIDIYMLGQ